MPAQLEVSGCTIVLIGDFNPAIFHPAWFAAHGLITEDQAKESEVQVVHPDIAQMTIGAVNVTVEQQRFVIGTASAPLIRTVDIAANVFGHLLTHTPIRQAGVNTNRHYRLSTTDERHDFGRTLAPIKGWGEWGERLNSPDRKDIRNGVQAIVMREYWFDDPWAGYHQVKIEPSTQIPNDLGVYIEQNHHIDAGSPSHKVVGPDLMQYIARNFDEIIGEADWIEQQLFGAN